MTDAFMLFALKTAKISQAYVRLYNPLDVYVVAGAAVAVIACVLWMVLVQAPRRIYIARLIAILAAGVAVELAVFLLTGTWKLLTLRALAVFLWDIVILTWLAVVTVSLWSLGGRLWGRMVLYVGSLIILVGSVVDTVYFLHSGSTGSIQLLLFAFSNFDLVSAASVAELGLIDLLLVIAPFIVLGSIFVYFGGKHALGYPGAERFSRSLLPVLLGAGIAVNAIALAPIDRILPLNYRIHAGNDVLRILAEASRGYEGPDVSGAVSFQLPKYAADVRLVRSDTTRPRNLMIIMVESLRSRSAPPENQDGLVMPFLDSLARTAFTRDIYTSVPFTTEALVALFAGIHPPSSGDAYYRQVQAVGLPALLRRFGGYETAFFTSSKLMEARGEYELLKELGFTHIVDGPAIAGSSRVVGYEGISDGEALPEIVQWLTAHRNETRPFFMTFLTYTSHHPYRLPAGFVPAKYTDQSEELNRYLNSLHYVDHVLSELWSSLENLGLRHSTAIVVVGDHGEAFGEHGISFHGTSVYEEVVKVPLYVFMDGVNPQRSATSGRYQQVDLFPTILDLLGYRLEGTYVSGKSILNDRGSDSLRIASMGAQSLALIADRYKYIYFYRRRPMQVFDIEKDPGETRDLAAEFPGEHLLAIEYQLLSWQREVNESFGSNQ